MSATDDLNFQDFLRDHMTRTVGGEHGGMMSENLTGVGQRFSANWPVFWGSSNRISQEILDVVESKDNAGELILELFLAEGDLKSDVKVFSAILLGELHYEAAFDSVLEFLHDVFDTFGPEVWQYGRPVLIVDAIAEIDGSRAVDPLIGLLVDRSHYVRRDDCIREYVLGALDRIGNPTIVVPLIKLLDDRDISHKDRSLIADSLGKLGDDRAVGPITKLLFSYATHFASMTPQDQNGLKSYVEALGKLGDDRAVLALIGVIKNPDMRAELGSQAIDALGEIGGDRAEDALQKMEDQGRLSPYYPISEALAKIRENRD